MQTSATGGNSIEAQDIIYVPRPDATPETEAEALASIYRFLLDSHAAKKDAADGATEDPQGDAR